MKDEILEEWSATQRAGPHAGTIGPNRKPLQVFLFSRLARAAIRWSVEKERVWFT
jgi:hypothetical protein